MQTLTPMTLYDADGRRVTVYVASGNGNYSSIAPAAPQGPPPPGNYGNQYAPPAAPHPQPQPRFGPPHKPAPLSPRQGFDYEWAAVPQTSPIESRPVQQFKDFDTFKPPRRPPSTPTEAPPQPGTNLYVSNLPDAFTKEALHALFTPHGTILSCRVARKPGQHPIGFVQFTDADMAQEALEAVQGRVLEGHRAVRIKWAHTDKDKGQLNAPSSDLYLSNVPITWTEDDLRAAFAPFGRILSLILFKDSQLGVNIGRGMVRFNSVADATSAIAGLHMLHIPGTERPLEVKYAENRESKERRHASRTDFSAAAKGHKTSQDTREQQPSRPSPSPPTTEKSFPALGSPVRPPMHSDYPDAFEANFRREGLGPLAPAS